MMPRSSHAGIEITTIAETIAKHSTPTIHAAAVFRPDTRAMTTRYASRSQISLNTRGYAEVVSHADDFYSYDPATGHPLAHDPIKSFIAPRPIGWMSTRAADGTRNLAPFSFFTMLSASPVLLGFASNGRSDSLTNAEATGEFTWNLVPRSLAEVMNETSAVVPPTVDEFALAGVAELPSDVVRPGRVAASPVSLECVVTQIVPLVDRHGASAESWFVIGQAVRVHVARDTVRDGVYDITAANPVMRAGGPSAYYGVAADTRFDLRRPGM